MEADILNDYAATLGADVVWTPGAESQLILALEEGVLDVVMGASVRTPRGLTTQPSLVPMPAPKGPTVRTKIWCLRADWGRTHC